MSYPASRDVAMVRNARFARDGNYAAIDWSIGKLRPHLCPANTQRKQNTPKLKLEKWSRCSNGNELLVYNKLWNGRVRRGIPSHWDRTRVHPKTKNGEKRNFLIAGSFREITIHSVVYHLLFVLYLFLFSCLYTRMQRLRRGGKYWWIVADQWFCVVICFRDSCCVKSFQ